MWVGRGFVCRRGRGCGWLGVFVFRSRGGGGFLLVEAPLVMQGKLSAGGLGLSLEAKGLIDGAVSTLVSLGAGLAGGLPGSTSALVAPSPE